LRKEEELTKDITGREGSGAEYFSNSIEDIRASAAYTHHRLVQQSHPVKIWATVDMQR